MGRVAKAGLRAVNRIAACIDAPWRPSSRLNGSHCIVWGPHGAAAAQALRNPVAGGHCNGAVIAHGVAESATAWGPSRRARSGGMRTFTALVSADTSWGLSAGNIVAVVCG